jgi:hypothetical protein
MANRDAPMGAIPFMHVSGGKPRVFPVPLKMTASTTIRQGDFIKMVAAGTIEPADADDGTVVIGVAASYKVSAATGDYYMEIYGPDNLFEIQADAALTQAAVGNTANHVATAGSSTISAHVLDASDVGTGAQLKIWGKKFSPDNDWGLYNKVIVTINENHLYGAVAGV